MPRLLDDSPLIDCGLGPLLGRLAQGVSSADRRGGGLLPVGARCMTSSRAGSASTCGHGGLLSSSAVLGVAARRPRGGRDATPPGGFPPSRGRWRDGLVGEGCGAAAVAWGGRSAPRRCQRLDRLRRTRTAIAPTAAEARAPLARRGSPATAPHVGATCAPLVRTKSGPVRVGTSAPYRARASAPPRSPAGRCATALWGEGCGVATSRRLSTVSHLPGRLHRRLMYVRVERICCLDKRRVAQNPGGSLARRACGEGCGEGTPRRPVDSRLRSLRDGFMGGGLGGGGHVGVGWGSPRRWGAQGGRAYNGGGRVGRTGGGCGVEGWCGVIGGQCGGWGRGFLARRVRSHAGNRNEAHGGC